MALNDDIHPSRITVINAPNPLDWPVTVNLTAVEFKDQAGGGVRPISGANKWPDVIPTGWDGPIHFSIWLFREFKRGEWVGSCFLEFYRGKDWTGAPLNREYIEWLGGRGKGYGVLETAPNLEPGERVGFMLTAGSQRLKDTSTQPGPQSPRERSNILLVEFTPNGIRGSVPVPNPTPEPEPLPPLPPALDTSTVVGSLNLLASAVDTNSTLVGNLTKAVMAPESVAFPNYVGRLQIDGAAMRLPWPFSMLKLDVPVTLTPNVNPTPIIKGVCGGTPREEI